MLLRRDRIEERVERRNLAIANDDYIQAGVLGRLAARAGTPSEATGIVKSLRLAARGVNEVRMCGTKITGEGEPQASAESTGQTPRAADGENRCRREGRGEGGGEGKGGDGKERRRRSESAPATPSAKQ